MTVYMMFPVGVFYWFNQPQFFEGWMMDKRVGGYQAECDLVGEMGPVYPDDPILSIDKMWCRRQRPQNLQDFEKLRRGLPTPKIFYH